MQVDDTLIGAKHRYHIERHVGGSAVADTYSAFSRRQSGRGLRRRYYALLQYPASATDGEIEQSLSEAFGMLPYYAHVEEVIAGEEGRIVVVARGKQPAKRQGPLQALCNKGYLMLLLSLVILILIAVRFFQAAP